MRRILITGATGFLGGRLVERLLDDGDTVFALVRATGKLAPHPNLREVVCDLEDPDFPRLELDNCDVVIHAAHAEGDFPERAPQMFALNVRATFNLLQQAIGLNARHFCFLSSGSVYGLGPRPFKESDPPAGHSFYARTKAAGESVVLGYGDVFDVSALRLFAPYGPGQQGRLLARLIRHVIDQSSIDIPDDGGFRINPIHVQDCVDIIVDVISAGSVGILNVGGEESISIKELCELIGERISVAPVFRTSGQRPEGDLVGDISALKNEPRLTNPKVGLVEGIDEMITALSANDGAQRD